MTTTHFEHVDNIRSVSKARITYGLRLAVDTLFTWLDRAKKRRELRELLMSEARVFKDIGLQRHDVAREAAKRFWEA